MQVKAAKFSWKQSVIRRRALHARTLLPPCGTPMNAIRWSWLLNARGRSQHAGNPLLNISIYVDFVRGFSGWRVVNKRSNRSGTVNISKFLLDLPNSYSTCRLQNVGHLISVGDLTVLNSVCTCYSHGERSSTLIRCNEYVTNIE